MPSIFDAATLIIYNVNPERGFDAAQTVDSYIKAARTQKPEIRDDFVTSRAEVRGAVHISLPLAVHEANHDAWRHVEDLGKFLRDQMKLECGWATSLTGDRSRAVSYVIKLIPAAEDRHVDKKVKSGANQVDLDRLFQDHPGLRTEALRVRIADAALDQWGIAGSPFHWGYSPTEVRKPGVAKGNLTLRSPAEVAICLEKKSAYLIEIEGSSFYIEFSGIGGLITPTTCTTIGLVVHGDGREEHEHREELQAHLKKYNRANGSTATVNNIRMSSQNQGYLLCDPCDIITAQGLCEIPMPNKRHFRQIFFANANPANYRSENEKEYHRMARELYEEQGLGYIETASLVPLIPKVDGNGPYRNREKPSELETLRVERLDWVFQWHQDQLGKQTTSPHRLLPVLYKYNVDIANMTKDVEHGLMPDEKALEEDLTALVTQIAIHEKIEIRDSRYDWAQMRRESISKILRRIVLRRKIDNRKHEYTLALEGRGLSLMSFDDPAKQAMTREEKVAAAQEELRKRLEALEAELADSIANDPHYVPSDTEAAPVTPPNKFRVADPVTPLGPRKVTFGSELEELPASEMGGSAIAPSIAPLAPPFIQPMGPPLPLHEIATIQRQIKGKAASLKAFASMPTDQPCQPRDKIQRELAQLQARLGGSNATSYGVYPQPTYVMAVKSELGAGSSSRASGSGTQGQQNRNQGGETPWTKGASTSLPPAPLKDMTTRDIKSDIKPDIKSGMDSMKPQVIGGNRWAKIAPRPMAGSSGDTKPQHLAGGQEAERTKMDIRDEIRRLAPKRRREQDM